MKFGNLSFNNICDILASASTIFTALICWVTCRTYNAQFKQIREQALPNLQILSIEYNKSDPNTPSIEDGKHCRIYKGKSIADIDIENNIAIFESTNKQIEYGFIKEIESHIGQKDAYFTYFNSKPHLIMNHAKDINSYIIDHSNTKITMHNYGAAICALSVESITIIFKDSTIEDLILYGDENNKITISPNENNEFILYLDEVTTDLVNSSCKVSSKTYEESPVSFDLLKIHMPQNVLQYKKTTVNLNSWNLYNEEHMLQIMIEYNGSFFTSSSTVLN